MYRYSYAEQLDDDPRECRAREALALEYAINLLRLGEDAGIGTKEAFEAADFVTRLWNAFIQDLVDPENDLPDTLRADLVSIGIWIIKEAALIRSRQSQNFTGVAEICAIIRDGLK
ncbi:MAG TPA: flagellar biosynthesis regulator FlaF [Methylocella sp.]|nr:flagellar biosynthesis regulator FlaF [Methylocella sp.]